MRAKRLQSAIDAEEDAPADMVLHHALDMMQRFLGLPEVTMNDGARVVNDG